MSSLSNYWMICYLVVHYLFVHDCHAKYHAEMLSSDQYDITNSTEVDTPSIPVHNDTSRDNEGADHDTEPLRNNGRGSHEAHFQNIAAETNGTYGIVAGEFQQSVLMEHNRYRLQMCATDLEINAKLHEEAQKRAHDEANGRKSHVSHAFNENIYVVDTGDPSTITGSMVVTAWYDEYKQYDVKNDSSAPHFTQLVWKNSKLLGVGHAYNGQNLFIVTLYKPPGNIRGQFHANVGCGPQGELKLKRR